MVDREVDGQRAFSMFFFFDIFDGWSIVKLTGLCGRSLVALGPLCAVVGRFGGLCWRSGGGLGTYVGDLEPLLGLYGRFWAALGASAGGLGCTWAALRAYVGDLGPLLGLYWRSWPALGVAVCDPGPLLEPMLAVLGRSWGLCGRSGAEKCEEHGYLENVLISRARMRSAALGAALGSYLGGLGPLLDPMLAVWGRSWPLCWRS